MSMRPKAIDYEAGPLLSEHDQKKPRRRSHDLTKRPLLGSRTLCVLHTCLLSLYVIVAYPLLVQYLQPEFVASPANGIIEYERREFFPVTYDNPFTGDPRPEFDSAWHDLLQYAHIRVSKEELEAANHTSLLFKDGTGYVAQLASTHQLHCLIRHYLHYDHYFPNASKDELQAQSMHVDHCLEVLRLSVMCSNDVSLTPFYFATTEDGLYYPFAKTRTYHKCAKWEHVQDWAKSRAVNLFDPDLLDLPPGATLLNQPVPSMVL